MISAKNGSQIQRLKESNHGLQRKKKPTKQRAKPSLKEKIHQKPSNSFRKRRSAHQNTRSKNDREEGINMAFACCSHSPVNQRERQMVKGSNIFSEDNYEGGMAPEGDGQRRVGEVKKKRNELTGPPLRLVSFLAAATLCSGLHCGTQLTCGPLRASLSLEELHSINSRHWEKSSRVQSPHPYERVI